MEIVVGLGTAGCNVTRKFEKYAQYGTYKIDVEEQEGERCFLLPSFEIPEDYENNPPDLSVFFEEVKDTSVLFVVCGASSVASVSLIALEQLKKNNCKISILCIVPEVELLGEIKTKQERVVRNVLQEYTRSGVFDKLYLASNVHMEPLVENLTIMNYHETINDFLVSTIHMVNVFNNTQSVSDTFSPPGNTARIYTFGFVGFESGEEKFFFSLDNPREKRYYYAISQHKLETEKHLFRQIVNQVKSKLTESTKVSYGIYSTDYEHDYVYVMANSSNIQKLEKNT